MADLIGWVDPDDLAGRVDWAGHMDADDLAEALEAAHDQCVAFLGRDPYARLVEAWARVYPGDSPPDPPARLRRAQTMQARALSESGQVDPEGSYGPDQMAVTVFPMDWAVKALLRPRRGARGPR